MPTPTTTKKLLIKVDAGGSKEQLERIADSMGKLNKNTKSLAGNMGFLTNAFRGWLAYFGVREITRMSDEMQNLVNRLKLITGSVDGAKVALQGLTDVAERTNQSVSGIGEVYSRLALSLQKSGATTQELLALTETLTNSFRVAGATTTETVNTIIQLSQAFSSGQLRGQELRSVMEQNATLATLLKERFGQDIYKKAEAGAISISEVLGVLAKNQQKINDGAKQLAPTFEQTLTKAFNKISLGINDLNQKFALSSKFADVMAFSVDHLAELLIVLGGVITVVAATRIPAMIKALNSMKLVIAGINPLLLALTAIATVGALIWENWDKIGPLFTKLKIGMLKFAYDVEEAFFNLKVTVKEFMGSALNPEEVTAYVNRLQSLKKSISDAEFFLTPPTEAKPAQDETGKLLDELRKRLEKAQEKAKKLKEELAELNTAYLNGNIKLEEYYQKVNQFDIHKIITQFKEGKTQVFKFHEEIRDFQIKTYTEAFNRGAISLQEFNDSVAASKLVVLNEQLTVGKMNLAEYTKELTKLDDKVRPGAGFYDGVHDFIESVGTLSQGISKVTSQAFEHLSDTLTNFIKTGKLNFADFTRAVLDDITAMIVRAAIVRPIAQGILGLIGESAISGSYSAPAGSSMPYGGLGFQGKYANGGMMGPMGDVPLKKYAAGGIAKSPQVSLFGEGTRPEAYVPLPDGRSIPVTMSGAGGVSINQTFVFQDGGLSSSTSSGGDEKSKQFADLMRRVATDTIIKEKRAGGLLANG